MGKNGSTSGTAGEGGTDALTGAPSTAQQWEGLGLVQAGRGRGEPGLEEQVQAGEAAALPAEAVAAQEFPLPCNPTLGKGQSVLCWHLPEPRNGTATPGHRGFTPENKEFTPENT